MLDLLILATEGGIPTSNPWSKAALPLGLLVFIGTIYLLLRSNLGTRRGYLVLASSFFAFAWLLSLFWTFGGPGTPPNTGPQNLPGQSIDAYQPIFVPFAPDSTLATEDYPAVGDYPNGFESVDDEECLDPREALARSVAVSRACELAEEAANETITFFGGFGEDSVYNNILTGTEEFVVDEITVNDDAGRFPVYAIPLYPTWQLQTTEPGEGQEPQITVGGAAPADDESNVAQGDEQIGEIVEGAEPVVLFAYFDAGSPYFPSLLTSGILAILLVLHLGLLWRDESREARERAEVEVEVTEERPVESAATPSG